MTVEGLEQIEAAGTSAGNYDMDFAAIRDRIQSWSDRCTFRILSADRASVKIGFESLPDDMDAFVAELYAFCPDLVTQGTGCVAEMVEAGEVPPNIEGLIEGVDFSDENYGLEILKRFIVRDRQVKLWWD